MYRYLIALLCSLGAERMHIHSVGHCKNYYSLNFEMDVYNLNSMINHCIGTMKKHSERKIAVKLLVILIRLPNNYLEQF